MHSYFGTFYILLHHFNKIIKCNIIIKILTLDYTLNEACLFTQIVFFKILHIKTTQNKTQISRYINCFN